MRITPTKADVPAKAAGSRDVPLASLQFSNSLDASKDITGAGGTKREEGISKPISLRSESSEPWLPAERTSRPAHSREICLTMRA
jgi:hypothetical protein